MYVCIYIYIYCIDIYIISNISVYDQCSGLCTFRESEFLAFIESVVGYRTV